MKLYELPRGSTFKIDEGELLNHEYQEVYYLDHLDGAYSVCYNDVGTIVHLSASTPVKKITNETLST